MPATQESAIHGSVLSIQSHVVHGYVGNRAAVFPLQLLGFEADFINSVQFSNHTGYPVVRGQRLSGQDVEDLLAGLEANNLVRQYTHVLTGYTGSKSFLESVLGVVKRLKENGCTYVCDPVLGDDGKIYVPEELIDMFREEVIQLADIITPNQFEAELISGRKISTEEDAIAVLEWFHERGIPTVVITSSELSDMPDKLVLYASSTQCSGEQSKQRYRIQFDRIEGSFTGTGDAFAALLLAFTKIHEGDLRTAIERALASVQAILKNTPTGEELRLIQSRHVIQDPPIEHRAEPC